jgi:hypothetical protein
MVLKVNLEYHTWIQDITVQFNFLNKKKIISIVYVDLILTVKKIK